MAEDCRRRARSVALLAFVALILFATASCGGGSSSSPKLTPVAADNVSLVYTTYSKADDNGAEGARLFETKPGESPHLIRAYPGSSFIYLLASPDGRLIALNDRGTMKILDRSTGDEVMTLGTPPASTTGAGPFASWTADSRLFAYSRVNYSGTPIADIPNSVRSGWIEIVDVPSKQIITPAWTKAVPAAQPSWSPVSDEFVAVDFGGASTTNRALIVGSATERRRTLTGEPAGNKAAPLWSPDGKHILYWVIEQIPDKDGNSVPGGTFVVDADGKNAHFLVQSRFASPQAWSPDGKNIALACPPEGKTTADGVTHICVVDIGSAKITRVTTGRTDFSAAYSPDGGTIAYLTDPSPTDGSVTLRTIRLSDKHGEQIATGVPFGGMTWVRASAP